MSKFIDPQGMQDAIYNFADNIKHASEIGEKIILNNKYDGIRNIIIVGMGGSAIGGDINKMLLKNDLSVPAVNQPIRIALTGSTKSPSLGLTLMIFGKNKSMERIDKLLNTI